MNDETPQDFNPQLAQLNGTVERLQAVSIDAVQTAGLTSRKEEARALRKQLTRQATELIERIGGCSGGSGSGCGEGFIG